MTALSPADTLLIQSSFEAVMADAEGAAALFYARLFELDPSVRPLFAGDLTEQGRKLMHTLAFAVAALDRIDEIQPGLRALGARHAAYGVTDAHYDTVGQALLWTLERALGQRFTDDARRAWASLYELVAATMRSAQQAASA